MVLSVLYEDIMMLILIYKKNFGMFWKKEQAYDHFY